MEETKTHIVTLLLLVLFGAAFLSFYAYWIVTVSFPDVFVLLAHALVLFALVFLYCLAATAVIVRKTHGYIVSPFAVWSSLWLISLVAHLYRTANSFQLDLDYVGTLVMMNLFALSIVLYAGLAQQFLVRKAFGFGGNEEACYSRSYLSSNTYEDVVEDLLKKNWLYDMYRLTVRKSIKPDRLKIEAYDNLRKCHVFFLVGKKGKKASINFVAYVKNTTKFTSFIHSPNWCKELVENIIRTIESRGIGLSANGLELRREALDYALSGIKPLISTEMSRRFALPFLISAIILMIGSVAYFSVQLEPALIVAIASLVLAFFVFVVDYHRKS